MNLFGATSSTDLMTTATNKVSNILNDLHTLDQCEAASNVVDLYEKQFPGNKEFVAFARDFLCDRTFQIYKETHNERS